MYEQMDTEKVLNIAERMEALVAELRATVVATPETVEETDTIGRLAVVSTDAVIIEHDGLKLKRVDRRAREGDYIRFINLNKQFTTDNKLYKVFMVNGTARYRNDSQDILRVYGWDITKPKIEIFEEVVEESNIVTYNGLKLRKVNRVGREGDYVKIIESWSMDLKTGGFYKIERVDGKLGIKDDGGFFWTDFHEDFKFVETYEVIDVQAEKLPFPSIELTANQKRAALIEKAKKFIEELKFKHFRHTYEYSGVHEVQAHFHRKNNRVTCVLNGFFTGKTYNVGRANCAPGDVFNADIGKAIALARALEIDVPQEFLEAVQPDDFAIGQVLSGDFAESSMTVKIENDRAYNEEGLYWEKRYLKDEICFIVDDTNAQYEVI